MPKPELWAARERAQFAVEQIQIGFFNGFPSRNHYSRWLFRMT